MKLYLSLFLVISLIHSKTAFSNENLIITEIKNDYTYAINEFQRKLKSCEEGNEGISTQAFSQELLSNKSALSVVINYYYFKSLHDCVQNELKTYSIETTKFMARGNTEDIFKMNYLIMNIPLSLVDARIEFNKLPNSIKEETYKIKSLEKPFDMLITMDSLNL